LEEEKQKRRREGEKSVEDAEREGGSRPSQQELALLGGLSLEEP
jgi:hypothetical protein